MTLSGHEHNLVCRRKWYGSSCTWHGFIHVMLSIGMAHHYFQHEAPPSHGCTIRWCIGSCSPRHSFRTWSGPQMWINNIPVFRSMLVNISVCSTGTNPSRGPLTFWSTVLCLAYLPMVCPRMQPVDFFRTSTMMHTESEWWQPEWIGSILDSEEG